MNKPEIAFFLRLAEVPVKRIAELLKVSPGRVSQLAHEYDPDSPDGDSLRDQKLKAEIHVKELQAQHRQIMIDKLNGILIEQSEVREVFGRVFSAFRQATKEVDRRYGPDAAAILIQAERSALRVQDAEPCLQDKK